MSKKFEVVGQAVEINGVTYKPGDIIDEDKFRPAPEKEEAKPEEEAEVKPEKTPEELSQEREEADRPIGEAESLVKSGHIKEVQK